MSSRKPRFKLEEKVDVLHNYRGQVQWCIGAICQIYKTGFYGPIVSYEYGVSINRPRGSEYMTKAESALQKLHTRTPIHNYLYNSQGKVCQNFCQHTCTECKKLCCVVCNLCEIGNQRYCGQCTPKVEPRRIAKAVATAVAECYSDHPSNGELEHFIDKLSTVIASYSIGFEFECCRITASNIKCTNAISFDNRFHLVLNQDMEHSEIYKYFIQRKFHETHQKVVDYPSVQVDGKIMQIFCSLCTADHFANIQCCCCRNRTYSTQCYNHPLCFFCQKWPNTECTSVCRSCHNYFCSECGVDTEYLCTICASSEEYERYHTLLLSTIGDIIDYDVCRVIAMYCSGFATSCCNKRCENVIYINSTSEWNKYVNSEGQKVYRYRIKKEFLLPLYKTYDLFGEIGRIFCAECTANKLMECKLVYKHLYNWDRRIIKDTDEMCKLHKFCGAGGTRHSRGNDGRYYFTKHCNLQRKSVAIADLPYSYGYRNRWSGPGGGFENSVLEDDQYENGTFEVLQCVNLRCCKARDRFWRDDNRWIRMSNDDDTPVLDVPKTKKYFESKDEHKNRRHLYKDVRFAAQKKKDDKAGILRSKKHKKRKSYSEKKKDRKSNKKMKEKFKRRYQLSLQF